MSMLSSVAERLYWLARYLERTEGSARILNAYSQMVLDIPKGTELGWETLIQFADAEPIFLRRYRNFSERNVLKFMIADMHNQSSLRFSVKAARENIRTTRDVLPKDAWEQINEFYLFVEENAEKSINRHGRFQFLDEIISRNERFNGLIVTTLSRDHAYTFLKIGQLLESADVASRMVDVAATAMLNREELADSQLPMLWANLLNSLSAFSAYRREIGPLVNANEVVDFIFKSPSFPRSISHCLEHTKGFTSTLKKNRVVSSQISVVQQQLDKFQAEKMDYLQLHEFINELQLNLGKLHNLIDITWFNPEG